MDANGAKSTNLSRSAAVDTDPAFSPDGKEIAFTSTRSGNYETHTINAKDGSNPHNRTKAGESDVAPDWGVIPF